MEKEMKALRWSEFDKNDRIVMKQKEFRTAHALNRFVERLEQKSSFNQIEAYAM